MILRQAQRDRADRPVLRRRRVGQPRDATASWARSRTAASITNHYSPDDKRAEVQEFVKAYGERTRTRRTPKVPDAMAILGYDAALVLIDAIKRAGSRPQGDPRRAGGDQELPRRAGAITIDEQRNARKPIVVLESRADKTRSELMRSRRNDGRAIVSESRHRGAAGAGRTCTSFLQQLINGLSVGATYALIALGYTMVYGVLRLINFAHGDVYMVGAVSGVLPGDVDACRWRCRAWVKLIRWCSLGAMVVCAVLGFSSSSSPTARCATGRGSCR